MRKDEVGGAHRLLRVLLGEGLLGLLGEGLLGEGEGGRVDVLVVALWKKLTFCQMSRTEVRCCPFVHLTSSLMDFSGWPMKKLMSGFLLGISIEDACEAQHQLEVVRWEPMIVLVSHLNQSMETKLGI